MNIQQVFNQQVEVGGADAAIMEVEVMAEDGVHLVGTALGGIAMPLPHPGIKRMADNAHVGGDGGPHIVAGTELRLFFGHDDGDFGMMGANHTQGFRPTYFFNNYITNAFFLETVVSGVDACGASFFNFLICK